jgi:glucan phosphoethanolaminetransferase (alkaline phosphatase superfamily)
LGQADRTIVILTADHGEMAGAHGLRQKGNFVYDENFHVPLVVRHPDVAGHRTSGARRCARRRRVGDQPRRRLLEGVRRSERDRALDEW